MAGSVRTSRMARYTTAATTLAAVLSVAGAASAATSASGGPAHHEARSGLSDAQVVRVFARVVEAMARDLLQPGHTHVALAESPVNLTDDESNESPLLFEHIGAHFVSPLPVRLLDLPPPTC